MIRSRLALPVLVISVAVALIAGGCSPQRSGEPLQPHTEREGPVGPVPQGLERFYGQQLSWGPCEGFATTDADRAAYRDSTLECTRLQVPLDYSHPEGRTINIGVLRSRAIDQENKIGSLTVNPGGPGASGMSAAASLTQTVDQTRLGQRFDLVGFDPRGVGASEPAVSCLTGPERDDYRLDSDADSSPSGVAETEREERDYARECAERNGAGLLANIGTRDVVRDLDVLRSALGDRKLNYLGYSYGTRIGSEYAEDFPGNIRTMILDGAIDPGQSTVDSLVAQGAGFQRAFDDFAAWCADQGQCALGDDPSKAVQRFQELTRPLVENPAPAGDRELSYSDATTAAIQALYAPSMWSHLNTGLDELEGGSGRILLSLADSYFGREPDGNYSNTIDAFDAIHCVDDERVLDPEKVKAADRRYREVAPFLDDGRRPNPARDMCAFWPVPVTGESEQPEVGEAPPTMVVSTTADPATPYQAGVELARALGGRLLTYEGTQHTVFLQGVKCVDDAGIDYLVEGELPPKGTRCTG